MAKKFVRGITGIKNIEHQDFDTNNVNDLLSDGKHNFIHRKKQDGTEEYHNLTNNIKTLQSDDTDLLTVTNYNNTTNSATIRPKHDAQKEQIIQSDDHTVIITHGENGTDENTNIRVDPTIVLMHNQLTVGYGLTKYHEEGWWGTELKVSDDFVDTVNGKQDTLSSNASIGVDGTGLMQLYSYEMSYANPLEGALNTYAKTVKKATQLTADPKLEYHFCAKLNDGIAGMTVELEDDDVTYFTSILDSYGQTSASGKTAIINGLLFTLNGSELTVSRDSSTSTYNQVVSFSDIIDPSQNVE